MQHVITIASSVTKVRWRPPAFSRESDQSDSKEIDRHESMFAVATARLTSAGGSGVISLWSTHRPYMPLSVVEGHLEGGIAGFDWIRTPGPSAMEALDTPKESPIIYDPRKPRKAVSSTKPGEVGSRAGGRGDVESVIDKLKDDDVINDASGAIWQHVLSVGRDGKCILQSFVRGDRPISRVPSSCFAMANLSPFQRGYGSLQVFSVHQEVPNSLGSDLELTGLRQDATTAKAPGVFKEAPVEAKNSSAVFGNKGSSAGGRRLPERTPELHFNVLDQGPLDENGLPLDEQPDDVLCVAPEVVHLSRFASSYKLHPDTECPTRVKVCLYNGDVAEDLKCDALARMWRSVAEMFSGSGLDELPSRGSSLVPMNVMHFTILPTLKSLLLERAEAGDVQTCVTLCEVMQVIEPDNHTRIPDLHLSLVREWYLSYIDLLQQMCLFTSATCLIKNCSDPFIAALNQQSTT
jgi:WD repeat-containing protein 24